MDGKEQKVIQRAEERANKIVKEAEEKRKRILGEADAAADREMKIHEDNVKAHYAQKKYDLSKEQKELDESNKQEIEIAKADYAKNEAQAIEFLLANITDVKVRMPRNLNLTLEKVMDKPAGTIS